MLSDAGALALTLFAMKVARTPTDSGADVRKRA